MRIRPLLKGLVVGGLVGFAVMQFIWRRRQSANEAVSELRPQWPDRPAPSPAQPGLEPVDTSLPASITEVQRQGLAEEDAATADAGRSLNAVEASAQTIDISGIDPMAPVEPDDLRAIEGIGPKIATFLNEKGILTYVQLAGTRADDLKSILAEAGPRFRLADPTTWPQQAQYAAAGDWDGLKTYQDSLK